MPPLYEYFCEDCETVTAIYRSMTDEHPPTTICRSCNSPARRIYSAQVGVVDGPSLAAVDAPEWPVDHNDPHKRRIVPNRAAWKERIKRSEGRLEDLS